MASSGQGLTAAGGSHSGSSSMPRRRPLPGETLIPTGFEITAHPIFWLLLRPQQPSPPRLQKETNMGNKAALISLEPSAAQLDHNPSDQCSKRKEEDTPLCPICHKEHFTEPAAIIDRAAIEGKPVNEQCRHVFCYKTCIVPWFQNTSANTNLCPLCKSVCSWLLILSGTKFRLVAVGFDSDELQDRPFPSKEVLARARRRLEGVKQVPVEGEEEAVEGGDEKQAGEAKGGGKPAGAKKEKRRRGSTSKASGKVEEGRSSRAAQSVLIEEEEEEEGELPATGEEWLARELAKVTRQIDRSKKKLRTIAEPDGQQQQQQARSSQGGK